MEETIRQIFNEIDLAIKSSISIAPVEFSESKFIKQYNKIKSKYL